MAVDEQLDQLLRQAIAGKHFIRFQYKSKERICEPHDYGIQNKIVSLLSWQISGQSSGRLPGWRWFDVVEMQDREMLDKHFLGTEMCRPASTTSGTKCSSEWRHPSNRRSGQRVREQ